MFTGASTAAVVSAYAAMAAAIAGTASAVVTGVQAHQAGKVQEAQARFNRDQELEAEKQAHQEESLNATQHYRAVRHEMAAGQNMMIGLGNVGTSAESALRGGYFNLSEDLSALRYKYDREAVSHLNAANNYNYNKKIAIHNRRSGVLASSINVASAAAKGVSGMSDAGWFNAENWG